MELIMVEMLMFLLMMVALLVLSLTTVNGIKIFKELKADGIKTFNLFMFMAHILVAIRLFLNIVEIFIVTT